MVSLLDAFNKPFVASSKPQFPETVTASTIPKEPDVDNLPSTPPTPTRPRDEGPSRSPSVGPDEDREATDAVWQDPLGDDSEEDEEGQRSPKRQRV